MSQAGGMVGQTGGNMQKIGDDEVETLQERSAGATGAAPSHALSSTKRQDQGAVLTAQASLNHLLFFKKKKECSCPSFFSQNFPSTPSDQTLSTLCTWKTVHDRTHAITIRASCSIFSPIS